MERLTSKRDWIEAGKDLSNEWGYSHIWRRLKQIEDILGDTYDLDRLREAIDKKDEYERFIKQWEQMAEIAEAVKKVGAERVAELVEADKQGRVKIYPKSKNSTCGSCGHFHRIAGTRRGTCDVKPFATTRRGASWGYEFMASQSRKACKLYKPAAEAAIAKEADHE